MSPIDLIVFAIIIGVLLYLMDRFLPMSSEVKGIIKMIGLFALGLIALVVLIPLLRDVLNSVF